MAPSPPQGGPAPLPLGPRFIQGPDAWERGAALLAALPQPLGLVAEAGLLKAFRKQIGSAWLESGVHLELLAQPDGGDCSWAARDKVLADARGRGVKALLGFGGGRMMDLAKAAAWAAGWRIATAPSSAATCACATGVAVINDEGAFSELLDAAPPELCLVDEGILAQAPPRLLAAGLADTLAKWLEWRALEAAPSLEAAEGWALAKRAAQTAWDEGQAGLQGDPVALQLCFQACLPWSAAASNAGQAPAAAAHSLANALSRQGPGRGLLHGEAVALGLLWQEALLDGAESANMGGSLRERFVAWGLPTRLPAGLDLDRLVDDAFGPGETVHLMELQAERARGRRSLPLG